MDTVLQVKATFCRSIKLNPLNTKTKSELLRGYGAVGEVSVAPCGADEPGVPVQTSTSSDRNVERTRFLRSQFVYSKNYVVIDRETKTSTRDWKSS